jgi:hypothetical protein
MKPNVDDVIGVSSRKPGKVTDEVIAQNTRVFQAILRILEKGDENAIQKLLETTEMLEEKNREGSDVESVVLPAEHG